MEYELGSVIHYLTDYNEGRYYGISIIASKKTGSPNKLRFYVLILYDSKEKEIYAVGSSQDKPDNVNAYQSNSKSETGWVFPVMADKDSYVSKFRDEYLKDKENYDKKLKKMIINYMI